jgi:hypothetical protein
MVIDESRNVMVGMTLVGPSVGELIHAATIAIVGAPSIVCGIPFLRIRRSVRCG